MDRQTLMTWILTAMVAAICAVGAAIKVPAFISTAALDSAPAFLGVVFLSPLLAGIAGFIGHFISALTAGFPLGPLHVIIAVEMFIVVWIFGIMHKKGMHFWKWPVALVLNGIVAPLPFYFIISPLLIDVANKLKVDKKKFYATLYEKLKFQIVLHS